MRKKESFDERISKMTKWELFEEFERSQHRQLIALRLQIVACAGSVICSIGLLIYYLIR